MTTASVNASASSSKPAVAAGSAPSSSVKVHDATNPGSATSPPRNIKASVLLAIPRVSASRLFEGEETQLVNQVELQLEAVKTDGDAFLLADLGGEFELPISARTPVTKQQGSPAYLIGAQDGKGFVKLTLPDRGVAPDQIDLLEACLSSWTTFASAQNKAHLGRLVLIDEPTGAIIAELSDQVNVSQDPGLDADSKDPVIIEQTSDGGIRISPLQLTESYGQSDSKIIRGAESFSRGVIMASDKLAKVLDSKTNSYISSRPPTESPLVFAPAAKSGVKGVHSFTNQAVRVSGKTAEVAGRFAGRVGEKLAASLGSKDKEDSNEPPKGWKATLNKSIIAFNTVADALEASGKHALSSSHEAATRVTRHRYGDEAADAVQQVGGSFGHVGLVYIDIRGISRRAMLKAAGKAAIKARTTDGKDIILEADELSRPNSRPATPTPTPNKKTQ